MRRQFADKRGIVDSFATVSGVRLGLRLGGWRVAVAAAVIGCAVSGCSMPIADLPGIGLPENIPARPAVPPAYLPVHDVPPPRSEATLDSKQQAKIENDLASLRDRQETGNPKTFANAKASANAKDSAKAKASAKAKSSAQAKPAKKPDPEDVQ
jgi:hypothetical protein